MIARHLGASGQLKYATLVISARHDVHFSSKSKLYSNCLVLVPRFIQSCDLAVPIMCEGGNQHNYARGIQQRAGAIITRDKGRAIEPDLEQSQYRAR